jgi:sec-independent protein translocase protein TatA
MFRNPTTDLIVVLVIVLLIFGPKRLPGLGKQLGTGLREFKDSVTGGDKDDDHDEHAQITQGDGAAAPTAVNAEQRPADPAASERRS